MGTLMTMAPPLMSQGRDWPSLFTAFTRKRYLGMVSITIPLTSLDGSKRFKDPCFIFLCLKFLESVK